MRASEIIRQVEQDGLEDLIIDVISISKVMPKMGGSLTDDVESTYQKYGIPHGDGWQQQWARTHPSG